MNSVLSFLSLLGKGLFSVIKWLLFKLGLWVPAVFSVLFWLVVLVTGTKFSDVLGVYIFGLCATVLFAAAITFLSCFRKLDRKAEKKRAASFVPQTQPAEKKVSFVEGAPGETAPVAASVGQDGFTAGKQEEKPLFSGGEVQPSGGSNAAFSDESAMESAYESNESRIGGRGFTEEPDRSGTDATGRPEFIRYNSPARPDRYSASAGSNFDGAFDSPPAAMRIAADNEKPRIFRTRMDESMLIYEYTDRLEFYKNTPGGLVLMSSEYKPGFGGRR